MAEDGSDRPTYLGELEAAWDRDWRDKLDFLDEYLVPRPDLAGPMYIPYLPWVGPDYRPGGILLMATAQNLGQFQPDTPEPKKGPWYFAMGWPDRPLWRLYVGSFETWRTVPIQPWMDGVLAAIAGLWMFAREGHAPPAIDDIARRVAATNFFKHSLKKIGTSGKQSDLNPARLPKDLGLRYGKVTRQLFVAPEVRALQPSVVIGFKTLENFGGFDGIPAAARMVNDPSWIKQGMSGVAAEGGSWRRRVEEANVPASLVTLVDGWLGQLSSPYSTGKREATRIYLLYTWLEFQKNRKG